MTTHLLMKSSLVLALSVSAAMSFGLALDSASDAVYTTGATYLGLNGGSGMNAWYEGPWGSGGMSITTAASAIGSRQFSINGDGVDARRKLDDPLLIGQSLEFDMMTSSSATAGRMGVEIRSTSPSPNRDMLNINGNLASSPYWRIEGGEGWGTFIVTAIPVASAVAVTITVTGADTADVTLAIVGGAGRGASETHSVNFVSSGVSPQIMNFFTYDGMNGDYYFNNIHTVPEPASLLALGGLTALMARRRRKN